MMTERLLGQCPEHCLLGEDGGADGLKAVVFVVQDPVSYTHLDVYKRQALPMLAEYCLPLVKVGGSFLAMKGASGEEELAAARGAIKKLGGEYKETRTLHLPGDVYKRQRQGRAGYR